MAREVSILGSLRVAGALVLDKENADFPSNPKIGTFLIKDQSLYCYIKIGNLVTWYPLFQNLSNAYIHTQALPSTQWSVSHKLNSEYYWYQIQDTEGNIISEASRTPVDNDNFILNFTEPVAGTCIVIGPNSVTLSNINASIIEVGNTVVIDNNGIYINGKAVLTDAGNINSNDPLKVNISDIIDNLTSTAIDKPLSANQGKVLREAIDGINLNIANKLSKSDIVDNLYDNDPTKPLSAKQGGALNNAISASGQTLLGVMEQKEGFLNARITSEVQTIDTSISSINTEISNINGQIGFILNSKLDAADIVDNLSSTDTNRPLSAAQGKALNDAILALGTGGSGSGSGGETSYLGQFVGDFYPVIGSQRIYPRSEITVTNIFAWMSSLAAQEILVGIRVNGTIVETVTIAVGNFTSSKPVNIDVLPSDYITIDVMSGNGKNLSVRLDF